MTDPEIEAMARTLARLHGSAMSHSNRDGEMQTVASSFAGHRWVHAIDEYADKKWRQADEKERSKRYKYL